MAQDILAGRGLRTEPGRESAGQRADRRSCSRVPRVKFQPKIRRSAEERSARSGGRLLRGVESPADSTRDALFPASRHPGRARSSPGWRRAASPRCAPSRHPVPSPSPGPVTGFRGPADGAESLSVVGASPSSASYLPAPANSAPGRFPRFLSAGAVPTTEIWNANASYGLCARVVLIHHLASGSNYRIRLVAVRDSR